jgi:hypothetical protein
VPQSYEDWRTCIVIKCGIPLTREYILSRLSSLKDATAHENRRFVQLYGEGHWRRVTHWFEMALKDLPFNANAITTEHLVKDS